MRLLAGSQGRGCAGSQRHLFSCQNLFSEEMETYPNQFQMNWGAFQGRGGGPAPPSSALVLPLPCQSPQGGRKEQSAAVRCPHPEAGFLRQVTCWRLSDVPLRDPSDGLGGGHSLRRQKPSSLIPQLRAQQAPGALLALD